MIVRRYEESDFAQIAEWGKAFGANYCSDQFPETGFIVDGLAAYFLYKTDSSVCFLENLISNKFADKELRDQAIQMILEATLKEAREQGFDVAYATTGIPSVVYRALRFGAMAETKQTLLTKKLNTDPS